MKLKKVIFDYGKERHVLEGKGVAEKWLKEVNSFVAIHSLRTSGKGMSDYPWKIYKREK